MNNDPRMEARVAALEETLRTLITWLYRELGEDAMVALLKKLEDK